LPGSSWEID
jgi:hypothetical protein